MLMQLVGEVPWPSDWKGVRLCAYVLGSSSSKVVSLLRCIYSVGREWGPKQPIYILQVDVKSTFDCVGWFVLRAALVAKGVHPVVIAAILEMCCPLTVHPDFADLPFARAVQFCTAIPQGGAEGPRLWNLVWAFLTAPLTPLWAKEGWAVNIAGFVLSHVFFADNVFLISSNKARLQVMVDH